MPRAHDNDVLVAPRDDAVCITRIGHVLEGDHLPGTLIDLVDRLEVCLRVGDAAPGDEDLTADLDRLAVPDVRNVLVAEHALLLGPVLHVEEDHVVVIEEVQARLTQLDLEDRAKTSGDLDLVEEAREQLQFDPLALAEVGQYV